MLTLLEVGNRSGGTTGGGVGVDGSSVWGIVVSIVGNITSGSIGGVRARFGERQMSPSDILVRATIEN
jgi:hypothetical protein